MPSNDDPYVRIYWRFADEFPDVVEDDAAFALYGRLLRLADMAWPASATLPFGVRKAALAVLTVDRDGGPLVQMTTRTTYRIRGMDKERGKRSQSGRHAAESRWGNATGNANRNADRTAPGNAETMPSQAEPSKAEESQAETDAGALPEDHGNDPWEAPEVEAMAWLQRHGCMLREGDGYHQRLIHAVERHGVNAMVGQFDRLARAGYKDGDLKGFLFDAIDSLDKQARPNLRDLEADERREEQDEAWHQRVAKTLEENRRRYPSLYGVEEGGVA